MCGLQYPLCMTSSSLYSDWLPYLWDTKDFNCHQVYLDTAEWTQHACMKASNISSIEILTAVQVLNKHNPIKIMLNSVVRNEISQVNAGYSDTRKPHMWRKSHLIIVRVYFPSPYKIYTQLWGTIQGSKCYVFSNRFPYTCDHMDPSVGMSTNSPLSPNKELSSK